MAIKIRNKKSLEFSTASMSDLVFLLLVFFILVSTIVSPNAIPLTLTNSSSPKVIDAKKDVTVYINDRLEFYINDESNLVSKDNLDAMLGAELKDGTEGNVILRVDQTVAVQYIVTVIDVVNKVNLERQSTYKVILATKPE
mgnify:CR=1 FL=1